MDAPIPREALEARIEPSQPDDAAPDRARGRRPRQPRCSPNWTRVTNVTSAPDLPHIAAGHPNNRPLHGLDNFTLTFSLDNGVAEGVVGALWIS